MGGRLRLMRRGPGKILAIGAAEAVAPAEIAALPAIVAGRATVMTALTAEGARAAKSFDVPNS